MRPEVAFGLVLKAARQELGISQEALALNSDLDRTFISMLERGKRQPSLSSILSISASLQVAPDELIKRTKEILDETDSARDTD